MKLNKLTLWIATHIPMPRWLRECIHEGMFANEFFGPHPGDPENVLGEVGWWLVITRASEYEGPDERIAEYGPHESVKDAWCEFEKQQEKQNV